MDSSQLVGGIITVLVILVVLFLLWYFFRRTNATTPTTTTPEEAPPPITTAAPQAAAVRASTPAQRDDLTVLEGIGPKVNTLLQNAGITTFAKLAETDPGVISQILQANRLQMLDPRSWPEQARLAAAGDQAGLLALQEKLKGGRAA